MTIRRAQRRALVALLAVWSVVFGALSPVLAAQESQVPAGHAQVISSGVDLMPRGDVAWRVTSSTARPGDEAEFFRRTLGFAIALDEPVLITNGTTGNATLVDAGQALFHPEGASERRSSVSNDSTEYVNIELIVAEDVDDEDTLGSSELLFAGDGFSAPTRQPGRAPDPRRARTGRRGRVRGHQRCSIPAVPGRRRDPGHG